MTEELALFAYGTLQLPQVQLATYGRLLKGASDVLPGYRLELLEIADEKVVKLSGLAVHQIARRSGRAGDHVPGTVLLIGSAELAATDRYEVAHYERRLVRLQSGRDAWAYLKP